MTKREFLDALAKRLSELPTKEIEERLGFYEEMIDDRIEEGISEEEAVLSIGSLDQILDDISAEKGKSWDKEKSKGKLKAWQIVLIAVGSPIWAALLISVAAVVISLYAVMWALVITLWAIFGASVGVAFGGLIIGVAYMCMGEVLLGIALIGAAITCAGLTVFAFVGSKEMTNITVMTPKLVVLGIKKVFKAKEETK